MRISDFLLDVNDLWGRVVPGAIVLLDIYLLAQYLAPFDPVPALSRIAQSGFFSTATMLAFAICAFLFGEVAVQLLWKMVSRLPFSFRPAPHAILEQIDVTMGRLMTSFYESNFDASALRSTGAPDFLEYCKTLLLERAPDSYAQSRKMQAGIDMRGALVLPLLGLTVVSGLGGWWSFAVGSLSLAVLFGDRFRQSFRGELCFVLQAYYHSVTSADEEHSPGEIGKR